jgi:hypothetical protein
MIPFVANNPNLPEWVMWLVILVGDPLFGIWR